MTHYENLSAADKRTYQTAVERSHHRRIHLDLFRLKTGDPVTSFTAEFMGGSVQGDVSRTPIEVLECDVLDEDYALDWTNGEHRHYKIRVTDSRFIVELDEWVDRVVFTGVIWDFERKGPAVSLVAHGMERAAMGSVRHVFTRKRKARATDVIIDLLKAAGANTADLLVPRLKATLPKDVTVGVRRGKDDKSKKGDQRRKVRIFQANQEDMYYPLAESIGEALDGRDLFPDGRGRFVLALPPKRASIVLTKDTLLSPVTERRPDDGEVTNTWVVLGANPKGPKGRVEVEVALPVKHALSAESMAWNGDPRAVIERIENPHLKTKKQARNVGERRRDAALGEMIEYEVEALPVKKPRPNELVSVPTVFGRANTRAKRWTYPLGPGSDPLVIGATRRRK